MTPGAPQTRDLTTSATRYRCQAGMPQLNTLATHCAAAWCPTATTDTLLQVTVSAPCPPTPPPSRLPATPMSVVRHMQHTLCELTIAACACCWASWALCMRLFCSRL